MSHRKTADLVREKILIQGPYTYIATPVVTAVDFIVPANVIISEIHTVTAGNIYVDTPRSTNALLVATTFDEFKVRITRIYTTGTTATGFTLLGVYEDETYGLE